MILLLLLAGLLALVLGAEALVRGASAAAARLGIPSLIIGLTVVAFGTSAPELAVSVDASLSGRPDIAVGNVVGSNLFNVLMILGLSAVVAPLAVRSEVVHRDIPIMIGVSVIALVFSLDGRIQVHEAATLLAGVMVFTLRMIRAARRDTAPPAEDGGNPLAARPRHPALAACLIIAGLALLVLGADWLVDGAVRLARLLGISELVIGLTVVAAGTSMPELATSVVASARGERDIAIGNVVGSNVFNVLAVMGAAGVAASDGLPVSPWSTEVDWPFTVAVSLLCWPLCRSGFELTRRKGAWLVLGFVVYSLLLACKEAEPGPLVTSTAEVAVVSWGALGLGVAGWQAWRQRRSIPPRPSGSEDSLPSERAQREVAQGSYVPNSHTCPSGSRQV